ncbi:zf-HC2 domain-containing protein [Amantichitinum ursilacus]|uniref:Putative zinc-finger domain-containing protein n=1 Tax=Amantichitinum ursilacus TaxID=857265 RepID=A0A0N0GLV2_9NEIS|nr:zf-HC2 domain-containing protein [Amantichitinum ursilacus]KPC50416.1 hypothetical protein WG78_17450 [Amantichitinum ursilacus]
MSTCKKISRLLSDALDRPLQTGEWLEVHAHLPICRGCRGYKQQISVLRAAAQRVRGEEPETR